jgi:hypothetical protein
VALPTNNQSGQSDDRESEGLPLAPRPLPPQQGGYVDDAFEAIPAEEMANEYSRPERPIERPSAPVEPSYPPNGTPPPQQPRQSPQQSPSPSPQEPQQSYPSHEQPRQPPAAPIGYDEIDNSELRRKRPAAPKVEEEYIDKENKKLLPFGGGKSTPKAGAFDARIDRRKKAHAIQYAVLGLLTLLVLLGIYNAIPKRGITMDDVNSAIAGSSLQEEFPVDRGRAFAEDFLQAYLNFDIQGPNNLLSFYYTGNLEETSGESTINTRNVIQRTITNPKVVKTLILTPNTASFEVSSLVEVSSPVEAPTEDAPPVDPASQKVLKWVTYNVNVFYAVKTDVFTVTADSPNLVPNPRIGLTADLPEEAPSGEGIENADPELTGQLEPVIYGFLKAFGESSYKEHPALDQYIPPNTKDKNLTNGLAGEFVLSDVPGDSIEYKIWNTKSPKKYLVTVEVDWFDADMKKINPSSTLSYHSRYTLELERQSNNQYLVTYFSQKYYKPVDPTQ